MGKFRAAFEDATGTITRLSGELEYLPDPAATPGDVLTVQPDGSVAAAPGGGGSGGVQVVTVPVSSAEILDLGNTPVVLVPVAPGSVAVVTGVGIVYLAGLTPYLDGGGLIEVTEATDGQFSVAGAGFWDQATDQLTYAGLGVTQGATTLTDYDGSDVVLTCDNNPTLGNGTLVVTVAYFLAYASG